MKELLKRHSWLALLGSLALILAIILMIIFGNMLFTHGTIYDDRLNNLTKLDKNVNKEAIEKIKENDSVSDASVRVQGKIIYFNIKFKEGTSLDNAKNIAKSTLENYSEEIVHEYDFGYYLIENAESEDKNCFKVTGTKHPNNDHISWIKS